MLLLLGESLQMVLVTDLWLLVVLHLAASNKGCNELTAHLGMSCAVSIQILHQCCSNAANALFCKKQFELVFNLHVMYIWLNQAPHALG